MGLKFLFVFFLFGGFESIAILKEFGCLELKRAIVVVDQIAESMMGMEAIPQVFLQ